MEHDVASGGEPQADRETVIRNAERSDPGMVHRHAVQRLVSMVAGPIWIGLSVLVMRFYYGWRIADVRRVRMAYRRIRAESKAPLLVYHQAVRPAEVDRVVAGSPRGRRERQ